jgi:hypothetical protein
MQKNAEQMVVKMENTSITLKTQREFFSSRVVAHHYHHHHHLPAILPPKIFFFAFVFVDFEGSDSSDYVAGVTL